jgi:hypothetical protein
MAPPREPPFRPAYRRSAELCRGDITSTVFIGLCSLSFEDFAENQAIASYCQCITTLTKYFLSASS